jgi:16S rRNA (guanine527-N7)-methyltransferase
VKNKNCQLIVDGLEKIGVSINNEQLLSINLHLALMQEWNKEYNLTAITDEGEIAIKHVLDSASILSKFSLKGNLRLADIGTGAGFPGLPLKIIRPDLETSFIESSQKKAKFLGEIVERLKIDSVEIINKRVEDVGQDKFYREKYDIVISRALASTTALVEFALPLVRLGGRAILYKSKSVFEELEDAEYAIDLLGGSVEETTNVVVPFLEAERYLLSIKKVVHTPQKYPRKAGTPVKKPLKRQ